jgi:hypothetical protein
MELEVPSFQPLDRSQAKFLRQRTARMLKAVPAYANLRKRLLRIGGIDVVPPVIDSSSAAQLARQRYDVGQVLQAGRTWSGARAKIEQMETNSCHRNVARICTSRCGHIASGWALSMDGLWREHSWLVRSEGSANESLIETTISWLLYHGYILNDEEMNWFIRAELGSNPLQ